MNRKQTRKKEKERKKREAGIFYDIVWKHWAVWSHGFQSWLWHQLILFPHPKIFLHIAVAGIDYLVESNILAPHSSLGITVFIHGWKVLE